jgi:hypothetical protein
MMAVRQTMMINESMNAYSTAVGPSSSARKRRILFTNEFIATCLVTLRKENARNPSTKG